MRIPRTLVISILLISVVLAVTVGATLAYFSGTAQSTATVQTAVIKIGETSGLPLSFTNLLPGDTQSSTIAIKNGSSTNADLYIQLVGDNAAGETNYCTPTPVVNIAISEVTSTGDFVAWVYNGTICHLYPGHVGSVIPQLADDAAPGPWRYFKASLTLSPTAGNEYQNTWNQDTINLIAVQWNGPAPQPDTDDLMATQAWPADASGTDQDLNYNLP